MSKMVRKQIYLSAKQDEMLKEQAAIIGISESELIRRRVDRPAENEFDEDLDIAAWHEAKKLIARRLKMKVPQTGRTWTRDDLYEERLARVSHR